MSAICRNATPRRKPGRGLRLLALFSLAPAIGGLAAAAAPIPAAVSVPPQAYLVERVGGDRVAVRVLLPPGGSPETFEPTPRQILAVVEARLYVKVGHPGFAFERGTLEELLAARPGLEIVDMAAGRAAAATERPGAAAGDPHVWLSPATVEATVREIGAALGRLDPEHRESYRHNQEALLDEIRRLDEEIRGLLDGLPRRRFLVFHPAWGHLAAAYGLEQVAIEIDGKEPSPARLVALIEEARREGIHTLFVQPQHSDRSARILAREIGARVVSLDPLQRDWPRALREAAAALREALLDA